MNKFLFAFAALFAVANAGIARPYGNVIAPIGGVGYGQIPPATVSVLPGYGLPAYGAPALPAYGVAPSALIGGDALLLAAQALSLPNLAPASVYGLPPVAPAISYGVPAPASSAAAAAAASSIQARRLALPAPAYGALPAY